MFDEFYENEEVAGIVKAILNGSLKLHASKQETVRKYRKNAMTIVVEDISVKQNKFLELLNQLNYIEQVTCTLAEGKTKADIVLT